MSHINVQQAQLSAKLELRPFSSEFPLAEPFRPKPSFIKGFAWAIGIAVGFWGTVGVLIFGI